ncbi:hypothetical protein BsWGS_13279 [Bradybaena similaris]
MRDDVKVFDEKKAVGSDNDTLGLYLQDNDKFCNAMFSPCVYYNPETETDEGRRPKPLQCCYSGLCRCLFPESICLCIPNPDLDDSSD